MPKNTEPPNPWCMGDGPLPDDERLLVTQIKAYAAARRNEARYHQGPCSCLGCVVRRRNQIRSGSTRRAV